MFSELVGMMIFGHSEPPEPWANSEEPIGDEDDDYEGDWDDDPDFDEDDEDGEWEDDWDENEDDEDF